MLASVDISATQNKHVTTSKPLFLCIFLIMLVNWHIAHLSKTLNAERITDLVVCVCVSVSVWQREAGVQRLSCHFSWPEFCDEQRRFHQEFVYDVAMFAAARGFPWPDVIRAAAMAKGIFPQLDGQSKQQCTVHAEALQVTQCFTWRSWSHTFNTANRESTMFPETKKKS